MYSQVKACRICGNTNLVPILDLGVQALTGVFPKTLDDTVTKGPLRLVKCMGDEVCGLVQLEHSYDLGEMYGNNYGYRSGLNKSMVDHLHNKVKRLNQFVKLGAGDLVIDIGSNDGTTLGAYAIDGLKRVGIDPTGSKFSQYYPSGVALIPDFFSARLVEEKYPNQKAKVVTSFSMFYDLENPVQFMKEVHQVLADDGVWVFEQSYMPAMLKTNSFDTVCHEHLEFYTLKQIAWMAKQAGFDIIDVEFNDVNGGSFSITVAKSKGQPKVTTQVQQILDEEVAMGLDTLVPFEAFAKRTQEAKEALLDFVQKAKAQGKTIVGLGASTKGNVLLQYCNFTPTNLPAIGEVNVEKYGAYTPGTHIPIIDEEAVMAMNPDYILVLPWHFRDFFLKSKKLANYSLLFPLPHLEVVPPRANAA